MNVGIGSTVIASVPAGTDLLGASTSQSESTAPGFGDVLKSAINHVSALQSSADNQVDTVMQTGQGDMGKTMISVEKADVAFQLMMQVRNKVVSAYRDIEKMQF